MKNDEEHGKAGSFVDLSRPSACEVGERGPALHPDPRVPEAHAAPRGDAGTRVGRHTAQLPPSQRLQGLQRASARGEMRLELVVGQVRRHPTARPLGP